MIGLISANIDGIRRLCIAYDVQRLWVFGSAVTDRWSAETSDIDFLAEFGESQHSLFVQHMGLIVDLQDLLGVSVEVVDIVSVTDPDFRDSVWHTRELLHDGSRHQVPA